MKKIRIFVAIFVAKVVIKIRAIQGGNASAVPGKIALSIYPDLIKHLASQVKKEKIVVCGTNGKTTVNNLTASSLEGLSNNIVCNKYGANLDTGVATSFIEKASVTGRLNADYCVLEIDELVAIKILPAILPDYVLLTNLFYDQVDRYGDIDGLVKKIAGGLKSSPKTKLIYNCDDPFSTSVAEFSGLESIAFSITDKGVIYTKQKGETVFCINCGSPLKYNNRVYGQLGDYYCPQCGFIKKPVNFAVRNIMDESLKANMKSKITAPASMKLEVVNPEGEVSYLYVNFEAIYMIYNVLAVYTVLHQVTKSPALAKSIFQPVLDDYNPTNGRLQKFVINGKTFILNLAKNQVGFDQNIDFITKDRRKKAVMIGINDTPADGTDVSWIWDVSFEALKKTADYVYVAGYRRYDLQTRFKYCDIDAWLVEDSKMLSVDSNNRPALLRAINEIKNLDCEVVYLILNYTLLFEFLEVLKGLQKAKGSTK